MNRVLLLLMVWFCACSPENTEIFDLSSSVDDIKLIKLRADHKMLLPDGIAQMEFHVLAYGAQEFTTYEIEEVEGQDQYVIGTSRDTFEIPLDRLPEGCKMCIRDRYNHLLKIFRSFWLLPGTLLSPNSLSYFIQNSRHISCQI